MKKIVQTAGRNALEEFSPEFAHFNDDILFGENWNNQDIDLKTRSIITVVVLMSSGITDSSLKYHLQNAKEHGVTQKEIAAIITHVAFYAGWPKGWAVFNLAKEVWQPNEGDLLYEDLCVAGKGLRKRRGSFERSSLPRNGTSPQIRTGRGMGVSHSC